MGRTFHYALMAVLLAVGMASPAEAKKPNKDRVARDFALMDGNGDGQVSREEWLRRGNFDLLDADGNGAISLDETRALYEDAWEERLTFRIAAPPGAVPKTPEGWVSSDALSQEDKCAIGRGRECEAKDSISRGFFATGLGPKFPDGALCRGVDDYYAMSYGFKRSRESYHGGIDLPVPWGTAMLAAADGTVVAKYEGEMSARGREIVLRHSPEETGLPFWVYTAYGHLDAMPEQVVGQRVKMGEVLGPTGNSGISPGTGEQSQYRRPAIHFAAFFSASPHYGEHRETIIPVDGQWMDPNALYRGQAPLDSASLKALPEAEKSVPVAVIFEDGTVEPPNAKIIWPYACRRR